MRPESEEQGHGKPDVVMTRSSASVREVGQTLPWLQGGMAGGREEGPGVQTGWEVWGGWGQWDGEGEGVRNMVMRRQEKGEGVVFQSDQFGGEGQGD